MELQRQQVVSERLDCVRVLRDHTSVRTTKAVLRETYVMAWVNGAMAFRQVCIDDHLEELVLGHLLTEGYISDISQVRSIRRELGRGNIAEFHVDLEGNAERTVRTAPTKWNAEWIFHLADIFHEDTELHARTRGSHSCMLAREEALLCSREDLGRHNALDKVVGWAMKNHVDLTRCILYSSGRIPVDMIEKVIACGVGVIVSNSTTTDQAIRLAEEHKITLLCNVRTDGFDVLHDAGGDFIQKS